MAEEENRTCIVITLRLSDEKSHAILTLFLRNHELTTKSVSYFLINQSKTKAFTDLKMTKNRLNQLKIAHDLILMRFLRILIDGMRRKGNDVISVNLFHHSLMRF